MIIFYFPDSFILTFIISFINLFVLLPYLTQADCYTWAGPDRVNDGGTVAQLVCESVNQHQTGREAIVPRQQRGQT